MVGEAFRQITSDQNINLYTGMQRRPEPGKGEAFGHIGYSWEY